MPVSLGIVRQRQQILALDRALGEKGDLPVVEVTVFEACATCCSLIVGDRLESHRALGKTDQYPFARLGTQPGADLLGSQAIELELHRDFAGLRGRLQLYQCNAVLPDAVNRLAIADADQLVFAIVLHVPPGTIWRVDAERTDRTGARRFAVFVEQSYCYHRSCLAVGNEH